MNSTWTRRGMVALALCVVTLLAGTAQQWLGQALAAPGGEQPKSQATTIALIDVAYIFKNHKVFTSRMKALEQKGQVFQQTMKATEARFQAMKERLKTAADEAELIKLEEELAKEGTDHQNWLRAGQSAIEKEEAMVYYESYSLLQEECKKYCRARGIVVLIKSSREKINPDDRNSVMQGLNRPIVFSDAPDISDDILKALDEAEAAKEAKTKGEKSKSR